MDSTSKIFSFDVSDKRGIVSYFYEQQNDNFHKRIHKVGGGVEENIKDTLNSISDSSVMYVVNVNGKMAAYFVWHETDNKELVMEGFHVLKEFRNRPFLTEFWQIVKDKFGGSFITGICSRNEPAIKSLMKAGFQPINVTINEGHVFIILKWF